MKLHELHRGRLEATVILIEEGLDRAERLLGESGHRGIVRAIESNIEPHARASLLEEVRQLRLDLRAFAEQFELQRRSRDVRQVCGAELASARVMLEDCRPKRMKGYGVEFSPQERAALDGAVDTLLERVARIRERLK